MDQLLQHLNLVQHILVMGDPLAGIASPVPDGMELVDGAVPAVAKDATFDIHLVVECVLVGNRQRGNDSRGSERASAGADLVCCRRHVAGGGRWVRGEVDIRQFRQPTAAVVMEPLQVGAEVLGVEAVVLDKDGEQEGAGLHPNVMAGGEDPSEWATRTATAEVEGLVVVGDPGAERGTVEHDDAVLLVEAESQMLGADMVAGDADRYVGRGVVATQDEVLAEARGVREGEGDDGVAVTIGRWDAVVADQVMADTIRVPGHELARGEAQDEMD